MATPSSVRFDDEVAARLAHFVATHPGLSASSATNLLVDEALRSQDHPLVVFRDAPAGRRARLVGGPDVWEVVRAVRSAHAAERELNPDEVVALVVETSGDAEHLAGAAVDYWADYPDDVDAWVERAERESKAAEQRWRREHRLLGVPTRPPVCQPAGRSPRRRRQDRCRHAARRRPLALRHVLTAAGILLTAGRS